MIKIRKKDFANTEFSIFFQYNCLFKSKSEYYFFNIKKIINS